MEGSRLSFNKTGGVPHLVKHHRLDLHSILIVSFVIVRCF